MKNHILPVFLAALLCAASCESEIEQQPTSVSVSPSSASIIEGGTANFSATVLPADAVYSGIIWSSSDTKVATVNSGVVTGVKAGTATITATADGVSGTATVTVTAKIITVTGVSLDKTEIELTEGDEAQLKATVTPENATDKNVTWKSSDETIATVSSDGKVTAVAPGETSITVTTEDGDKTATCAVTVNAKIYPVESVSLDKSEIELTEGDEAQLTATIAPENATNKNVTWSSSDEAIATVTAEGKVTAVKAGSATITVTTKDGGKTATCAVTVNAKIYPVESITLDKTTLTLLVGGSAQLTATVKPDNASNKNVTWKSSSRYVQVSITGKVTASKAGTATITATTEDGGKTATCTVTVNAKIYPVESITLDKTTLTLTEGDNAQLTATVKPDNASNKNVTWKSSNTGVAKVSSEGKVTAVAPGTATITVTTEEGGKTATCTVTVNAKIYPVVSIELYTSEIELTEGNTEQLRARITPDNATNKNVTWKSSNASVATVSNGLVTGVKAGTANITVTTEDGSKTATCKVTVKSPAPPTGALSGKFTINSNGDMVYFSKGNLQATYNRSRQSYSWGFAANQWDIVGNAAGNTTIDNQADGKVVDLFGWSTQSTCYGINTSTESSDYSGNFVDWGRTIDSKGTWRTLSLDEYCYLIVHYPNKWTSVGGTMGVAIAPSGCTIRDKYSSSDWAAAEAQGFIFLPAAGYRNGNYVSQVWDEGRYWLRDASQDSEYCSAFIFLTPSQVSFRDTIRDFGQSVRLVTDVK